MPALMDSAVLLAASSTTGVAVSSSQQSLKAKHELEAGRQLHPELQQPAASGALDDWQVLSMAEIEIALRPTLVGETGPDSEPAPLDSTTAMPLSPNKQRTTRSRRGQLKSGSGAKAAQLATVTDDGADADAEAAAGKGAGGRTGELLPGSGVKNIGLRAWNPFAGLKFMGPRHKAGSHILDLVPTSAAGKPSANSKPGADGPTTVNSASESAAAKAPGPAMTACGETAEAVALLNATASDLTDSTPDIDAAAADTGCIVPGGGGVAVAGKPAAAGAANHAPDYDTARECGGLAGGKTAAGSRTIVSQLPDKAAVAEASAADAGDISSCANCNEGCPPALDAPSKVPAAASDYTLPRKVSTKKYKKTKRSRK